MPQVDAATEGRPTSGVDDPQSFSHRFASVNGICLHYVEESEGPLVMLLHGYPFLWYLWRHQIKVLAAAGYRVVAADQRGYGQTDCPEDAASYDMTHLVGDIVGLINTLGQRFGGGHWAGLGFARRVSRRADAPRPRPRRDDDVHRAGRSEPDPPHQLRLS